ncbi:TPA: hypothetical protein HA278_05910 [Candidatus Woesearchaeota archaeon]|nr:hypothetical protein [archaeon]HIJ11566.1 hypothetical protein [Candidatus Woesearchaeota archaeon]
MARSGKFSLKDTIENALTKDPNLTIQKDTRPTRITYEVMFLYNEGKVEIRATQTSSPLFPRFQWLPLTNTSYAVRSNYRLPDQLQPSGFPLYVSDKKVYQTLEDLASTHSSRVLTKESP